MGFEQVARHGVPPWGPEGPPWDPGRRSPWEPGREVPSGPDGRLDPWLRERLFAQRMVMAHGPLTAALASDVAAQLLTLEASGDGPVRLHLTCPDGDLGAAFALVDTLDLVGFEARAVVTGELGGGALAVLTAAKSRAAYPHARVRLAEPRTEDVSGTADEIVGAASRHLRMLEDLIVRLAALTGKPRSRIETDLSDGRLLSAEQALEYGLLDEIVGPGGPG